MIKTSTDFANSVKELSRAFRCRLKRSDSIINCTVQKLSVYKGIMGDKVAFGSVYIPYMEAELQEFSGSLMGSLLSAEVGILTGKNEDGSNKFEYLKIGTFEVSEESYNDGVLKIKAVGSLSTKFVGLYSSELSYPASVLQVAEELTSQTGVNINFDSSINTSATIQDEPKGLQRSEILCYLAGLVGACATEDADGNVVIKRIASGESIELTGERCIQVPSFSSSYDLTGLRVVAGNSYEDENGNPIPEKSFSYGGPIKMEYSNPFMKQSDFDLFAADVVGYSFNPATVPLALGDPRIEPWDYILFTGRKGQVYTVPCLNIEHTFDGGFSTKITAPGAENVSESSSTQTGPISKMVERTYTKMEAVEHMLAGKIEATEVEALYAKVNDLNATKADIGSVRAEIADINTLLFGSATGDVLQTDFANATIALISDATIDSAKIISLVADKIISGKLDTNKVTVQSESGQLKITGDTIIIRDTNRTRVQIGKDANSDYNIYILDADGKVMFDATGIHSDAIKNPIIVDDMVAENANISAKKFDIDSLFAEINQSEKTIKATRVVFDDTGQELSVAFSRLSTDIDNAEKAIQSQGTALNMLQDQISTKIWQSDINTAVDNLEIGGRNLLRGTKDFSGFSIYGVSAGVKFIKDSTGFTYTDFPAYTSNNSYGHWILSTPEPIELEEIINKDFVFSYEYRTPEASESLTSMCVEFSLCSDENTNRQVYKLFYLPNKPISTDWQKIVVKGQCIKSFFSSKSTAVEGAAFENCTRMWVRVYHGGVGTNLHIRKCKLELGNKVSDWTPAPEDMEKEVDTKYTEISNKYTEMKQDVNGFKTTVAETYTTKRDFGNLKIGGRNLLRYTKELPITEEPKGEDGVSLYSAGRGALENTEDGLKLTFAAVPSASFAIPLAYDGCIDSGDELTLSFMYRGNITNPGNLYLLQRTTPNVSFNLSSKGMLTASEEEWQKFEATFSMAKANERICYSLLLFYGLSSYTADNWIEIKKETLKLEKSNKATDWTAAPEDTEAYISKEISNAAAQITQTSNDITMSVLKGYVTTSDIEEYKRQIENLLSVSEDGFSFEFNQLEERLTALGNEIVERNQFIRLENGEIIIGKSDSPITSVYTNNALEFRYNGVTVARFTNEVLEVRNINVENQLRLHENWAFRKGKHITGKGNNLNLVMLG